MRACHSARNCDSTQWAGIFCILPAQVSVCLASEPQVEQPSLAFSTNLALEQSCARSAHAMRKRASESRPLHTVQFTWTRTNPPARQGGLVTTDTPLLKACAGPASGRRPRPSRGLGCPYLGTLNPLHALAQLHIRWDVRHQPRNQRDRCTPQRVPAGIPFTMSPRPHSHRQPFTPTSSRNKKFSLLVEMGLTGPGGCGHA